MKKGKKIEWVLGALLVLSVFVMPTTAQTISIDHFVVPSGGTINVPIMATPTEGGNIAAIDITLKYDPNVIIVPEDGIKSVAFPVLAINIDNKVGTARIVGVNIYGVTNTIMAANVQFNSVGTADNSPVTIIVNTNGLLDIDGVFLTPTTTNGSVTSK